MHECFKDDIFLLVMWYKHMSLGFDDVLHRASYSNSDLMKLVQTKTLPTKRYGSNIMSVDQL